MSKKKSAYAEAGVDIDIMMSALTRAKTLVKGTKTPGVMSGIGSFGGMFKSPGKDAVLVSSTDGVGTKLKVASMAGRHGTIGQDLVNHCVNDILVQGAKPMFFLDYLGTSSLDPKVFLDVVAGLCKACKENGCALLGGETAEMPGLYPRGEYDLVGTIVGSVERKKIVTGDTIKPGDTIIGLPSSGLHTNGYSLARKVIFDKARLKIGDTLPGTRRKVSDVLLAVHKSYLKPIDGLSKKVRIQGLAHITGGGLVDNVPRIMPAGACAVIDRDAWKIPPVFQFIQDKGKIDREEMFRVFNMGIGMVLFIRAREADRAIDFLKKQRAHPVVLGRVEKGRSRVKLIH